MCGIIGYTGTKPVAQLLIEGLQQLEYRGYDSAGVSISSGTTITRVRAVGYVEQLRQKIDAVHPSGTTGIAHTRWATHGSPSERNAHPQVSTSDAFHVVHNGIIENYKEIRARLGPCVYASDTDTEVIVQLMDVYYAETHSVAEAFKKTCNELRGSYAIALLSTHEPGTIFFARKASPLLIGVCESGAFICSDIGPLMGKIQKVLYVSDGDIGYIDSKGVAYTIDGKSLTAGYQNAPEREGATEKGVYKHFMEKEMKEAPQVIQAALRGRLHAGITVPEFVELEGMKDAWKKCTQFRIVACGTSFHAALYGKYILETISRIPVVVEIASEFRYRTYIPAAHEILIVVSQSGETADTIAALQCAKACNVPTVGIVNVEHSTIARAVDTCILLHAGPEMSVASTKACVSQSVVFALLALLRVADAEAADELRTALLALSIHATSVLERDKDLERVLECLKNSHTVFCLGRGGTFSVALEAALKLKEVAYIHAEGYPGGELKHGSLALIDTEVPTIVFVPEAGVLRDKMLSNVAEIHARGGATITVSSDDDGDSTIHTPKVSAYVAPILHTMIAHEIAYCAGLMRGTSIDKPRNLAKAVTVE
jgi:glutamine---fructose-6-phosphate transaminase (isomerizing)